MLTVNAPDTKGRIKLFVNHYKDALPTGTTEIAVALTRAEELIAAAAEMGRGKAISQDVHDLATMLGQLTVLAQKANANAAKQEKQLRLLTKSEKFMLDSLEKTRASLRTQRKQAKTKTAQERLDELIEETNAKICDVVEGRLSARMQAVRENELNQRRYEIIYKIRRTTDKAKLEELQCELTQLEAALVKERKSK